MAYQFHAQPFKELGGNGTESNTGGGFTRTCALKDRTGFVKAVFLHPGEIGVPRRGRVRVRCGLGRQGLQGPQDQQT